MRLGSPVTSLSLSPAQDLLATCHTERKGIYLWANQLLFGSGADVVPSTRPVSVRLPAATADEAPGAGDRGARAGQPSLPQMLAHTAGAAGSASDNDDERSDDSDLAAAIAAAAAAASDTESESGVLSDDSDEGGSEEASAAAGAEAPPPGQGRYARLDAAGAPVPLEPELVTLGMLPRSQWQGLVHLETIKVGPWASWMLLGG